MFQTGKMEYLKYYKLRNNCLNLLEPDNPWQLLKKEENYFKPFAWGDDFSCSLNKRKQNYSNEQFLAPAEILHLLKKIIDEKPETKFLLSDFGDLGFESKTSDFLNILLVDQYQRKLQEKEFITGDFGSWSSTFVSQKKKNIHCQKNVPSLDKDSWPYFEATWAYNNLPKNRIYILLIEDTVNRAQLARGWNRFEPESISSGYLQFVEKCVKYVLSYFEREKNNYFTPAVLNERKAVLTSVYNVIHKQIYRSYTPFQQKKLVSLLKKYIARKLRKLLYFFRVLNKKATIKRKRDLRKIYATILRVHFKSSLNDSADHNVMNQTGTGKLISLLSHSINNNVHSGYDRPSQIYEIAQHRFRRAG